MGQLLRHHGRAARAAARCSAAGPRRSGAAFGPLHEQKVARARRRSATLEKGEIGDVNYEIERLRLAERRRSSLEDLPAAERARREPPRSTRRARRAARPSTRRSPTGSSRCASGSRPRRWSMRTASGETKEMPVGDVVRAVRPNALGALDKLRLYVSRVLGVPLRRPARVEHRGRHLPGHLRHRDDGLPDVLRRGAVRRAGGALPARVRQAGAARAHGAHRGQQPGRRALDRLRRLRPRASSSTSSAARIDRLFYPEALPTPTFGTGGILWAAPDARPADRAGGHRGHRGGAGRGAAHRARGLARPRRHQVRDDLARRAAGRGARAS